MSDALDLTTLSRRYGLSPDAIPALHKLVANCEQRLMVDGAYLCEEGRPSDGLYLLIDGFLRVEKRDAKQVYRQIAVARSPSVLGHMGLVTGVVRTAALSAEGGARVAVLAKADFDRLMKDVGTTGDALRRLVLSAMLDQADRAAQDVRRLLAEAEAGEGFLENDLSGWSSS
jgi:CRP-like cAMP-binding protein